MLLLHQLYSLDSPRTLFTFDFCICLSYCLLIYGPRYVRFYVTFWCDLFVGLLVLGETRFLDLGFALWYWHKECKNNTIFSLSIWQWSLLDVGASRHADFMGGYKLLHISFIISSIMKVQNDISFDMRCITSTGFGDE